MVASQPSIDLQFTAQRDFIPMVQAVVENGAPALGLGSVKTMRLIMAVEELVAHMAETAPGSPVRMQLLRGGGFVGAEFTFSVDFSDLWAMNLAVTVDVDLDGAGMEHMGLLLASRMVDSFRIDREGGVLRLTLRQNREYPKVLSVPAERFPARGAVAVEAVSSAAPDEAEVQLACELARALYPASQVPSFCVEPGRVADLLKWGEMQAAVARDATGALAGILFWEPAREKLVGFHGPMVFCEERKAVAAALAEHMIGALARTQVKGLYSQTASDDIPSEAFELLVRMSSCGADGVCAVHDVWYLLLREDLGAAVWAHPDLIPFLEATYRRLFLVRDVRGAGVEAQGGERPARSVFATELIPERSEVVLRPMLDGSDIGANASRHAQLFRNENYASILVFLDLAVSWQGGIAGELMACGFEPKAVLPYAGKADIVVLQHVDPAS